MVDLCHSEGIGHHDIPDPPYPFHSLWMAVRRSTATSWFPISINGHPVWGQHDLLQRHLYVEYMADPDISTSLAQ